MTGAIGDFISLNCTATGAPLPTMVWKDGEGGNITDDEVYNITTDVSGNEMVISVLDFVAFGGVNRSQFRCVAENRAGRTESELATIIIGGEMERDACLTKHQWVDTSVHPSYPLPLLPSLFPPFLFPPSSSPLPLPHPLSPSLFPPLSSLSFPLSQEFHPFLILWWTASPHELLWSHGCLPSPSYP